jgi:hypothetical protein
MDVGQGDTEPDAGPQEEEEFPDLARIMTDVGMTNQGIFKFYVRNFYSLTTNVYKNIKLGI